jgi:hypothetical protein
MAKQPREPRIDAKLKRAHPDLQRELWELRNPPDPEQKPLSFDALHAEVPRIFGFTVAAGSLSEWLAWYGLKLRMELAEARKLQAMQALAESGELSPEAIARAGNAVFMTEALVEKNLKGFAIAKALHQEDKKLEQKDRSLKQKDRALEHDERRIAILEAAAAEAKEKLLALTATAKTKGGLTPETLAEIEAAAGLL